MKEVFSFGMFTWIQAINGMVLHQLDRVLIGTTMGPASVGYYAVSLQIVQTAHGVLVKASAFLFPIIVKFREECRWDELWSLFQRGMIITTLGGWLISGGIITFGKAFLAAWMGAQFAEMASETLQILAIWNACLATTIVQLYFLNATGGERLNAGFGILSSGLFVIGALILIPSLGAKGAAMARLFAVLSSLVTRTVFYRRVFDDRRWFACILPLIPLAPAIVLTVAIMRVRKGSGALDWGFGIFGYILSSIICYLLARVVYDRLSKRICEAHQIRANAGCRSSNSQPNRS